MKYQLLNSPSDKISQVSEFTIPMNAQNGGHFVEIEHPEKPGGPKKIIMTTGVDNSNPGMVWLSCTRGGYALLIDTHGSDDPRSWSYTPFGGCPPGKPWMEPL